MMDCSASLWHWYHVSSFVLATRLQEGHSESLVLEVDYVVHSASDQMDLNVATISQARSTEVRCIAR
jgi:hypothetical protein